VTRNYICHLENYLKKEIATIFFRISPIVAKNWVLEMKFPKVCGFKKGFA